MKQNYLSEVYNLFSPTVITFSHELSEPMSGFKQTSFSLVNSSCTFRVNVVAPTSVQQEP